MSALVGDDPDTCADATCAEAVDGPGGDTCSLSDKAVENAASLAKDAVDEGGEVGECCEHQEVADQVGAGSESGSLKAMLGNCA